MVVKVIKKVFKGYAKGYVESQKRLAERNLGMRKKEKKPIQQPKSDVDISPRPESARPAEFPEYRPRFEFNPDGSVKYSYKDKAFDLSKEEYKQYQAMQTGGRNAPSGKLSPNVKALNDYEAVQRALSGESLKGIPEGISNQEQLDLYNEITGKEQLSKEEEIRAVAAREAAKPVEPLQKAGTSLQKAGFAASGLIGGGGVAGLAATGAIGAAAAAAAANPAVLAAGAAIITAKSLMAAQGKNREQDILSAKATSIQAQKFLNFYKAEALNPLADKDDLISDYYEMKRQVYAAQAMLAERSLFDRTFRVNTGADELAKIEIWMANEDNLDRDFFNNLAFADGDLYNSRIGQAVQAFNQEAK